MLFLPSLSSLSMSLIVTNLFLSVVAIFSATINGSIKSIKILPGEEAKFMEPESNASLYGDPAYYVFNEDGTGTLNVIEGNNTEGLEGTLTVDAGVYTFTRDGDEELSVVYDVESDSLIRVYKDDSAGAPYSEIKFFYTRR